MSLAPFVRDNLRFSLRGKNVLLGISGSIAAFKACDIVRYLKDCGADVRCVLTENGERFVTRLTLENLSGQLVLNSLWDASSADLSKPDISLPVGTHHISTARWADVAIIAPATANTIAKLAHGICDDLLTTELLALKGPIFIAPAMNPAMFENPATQANIETLKKRGVRFIGPTSGLTSCGEDGLGRMAEPGEIVEHLASAFHSVRKNKKALLTVGPTRSAIDPVRYLTNRSSGKMGAALAWALTEAGFDVTVLKGDCSIELPRSARVVSTPTAADMHRAATELWPLHDLFIAAAAVLDWDVAESNPHKLKKSASAEVPTLRLKTNPDILATIAAQRRPDQFVLGFAAETDKVLENALAKLVGKRCSALFVNDVSIKGIGFESDQNSGFWLTRTETKAIENQSKPALARKLVELAVRQWLPAHEAGHETPRVAYDPLH